MDEIQSSTGGTGNVIYQIRTCKSSLEFLFIYLYVHLCNYDFPLRRKIVLMYVGTPFF